MIDFGREFDDRTRRIVLCRRARDHYIRETQIGHNPDRGMYLGQDRNLIDIEEELHEFYAHDHCLIESVRMKRCE